MHGISCINVPTIHWQTCDIVALKTVQCHVYLIYMYVILTTIIIAYCVAGKFGVELNLAVWQSIFATTKLKSAKILYLHIIIHMAIPYRAAKFKSANV